MRIALLTQDFPGAGASGIGSYTLHCALALARFGGHEPHIFTIRDARQVTGEIPAGVHLHALPGLAERVASGAMSGEAGTVLGRSGWAGQLLAQSEVLCQAVRGAHENSPFDVIETPEVYFPGLPLMLRPIAGVPVVAMLHAGTAISRHFNDAPVSEEDRLIMALESAALCLADSLCAPTQAVVDATRQFIANLAPVTAFPSPPPAIQTLQSATPDPASRPYVMFAGRIERLKGCPELALAANIFLRACPDAELRLYGPDRPLARPPSGPAFGEKGSHGGGGSTRQWMIDHLDPVIAPRVRFMGAVPLREMEIAHKDSRFAVAPSRFENFGTAAVEALVAGRTVVYAAGTGMAEIISDAGLAAPADDPEAFAGEMIRLWNDSPLRRDLQERGARRLLEELSPKNAVVRRVAFYKSCIAAKREGNARPGIERLSAISSLETLSLFRFVSGLSRCMAGIGFAAAESPGGRASRAVEALKKSGKTISSLWIYGGGQHTRRLLVERRAIENAGATICGIIDDSARPGETLLDLPVITRAAAEAGHAQRSIAIDVILISADSIEEKLWLNAESFRQRNVPVARLYA